MKGFTSMCCRTVFTLAFVGFGMHVKDRNFSTFNNFIKGFSHVDIY